jgi:2,3-bisphosphoglycerate-independent phosphoglycerate mutase
MDPVEPGLACGSDTSHMALLGYDPRQHYRGRGAFEALGAGLTVREGDVAFKSNFATVEALERAGAGARSAASGEGINAENIVLRRRADREFEREGPVLCEALDGLDLATGSSRFAACEVEVRYATEHRCGVVLRRRRRGRTRTTTKDDDGARVQKEEAEDEEDDDDYGLSDAITGTDPLRDGLPLLRCEPAPLQQQQPSGDERECRREEKKQRFTCDLVNYVSDRMRAVLEAHPINAERVAAGKPPANVVLLRGAGARLTGLPPFGAALSDAAAPRTPPLRACLVAPTKIIAGVGITFGLDAFEAAGATGDYRSDLSAKAAAVAAAVDPLSCSSSPSSSSSSYDFALLHVKAVDDAGHDRAVCLKVRLLEVVDAMLGQLLARLRAAERAQEARWRERQRAGEEDGEEDGNNDDDCRCSYAVCVTGDHSTPAVFGDHSHEPVPFAVARVRDAVAAMGGEAQLELRRREGAGRQRRAAAGDDDSGQGDSFVYPPIPMPDPHAPPPSRAQMVAQLRQQEARHAAAARGVPFGGGGGGDAATPYGPWPEAWPSRAEARYDGALRFDEQTAGAQGGLGRFNGSEVMGLLAPFLGSG